MAVCGKMNRRCGEPVCAVFAISPQICTVVLCWTLCVNRIQTAWNNVPRRLYPEDYMSLSNYNLSFNKTEVLEINFLLFAALVCDT